MTNQCEAVALANEYSTRSTQMTTADRAQPDCPECDGTGLVLIGGHDADCPCLGPDPDAEPEDDPDAWSGGFAENH